MQTKFLFIISVIIFLSYNDQFAVKIEINNLKNSDGKVLLEFNDAEKNFIKGVSKEIVNNQCIITITNLSPGKYAFKYFHDENDNKKLDLSWVGIPKEGYGFSNNAKGTFGPPSHGKMIFELTGDTTLRCNPVYFKK